MSERTMRSWQVTVLLAVAGAVGGALAAIVLTPLGNIIANVPLKPGTVVYTWNIGVFAVIGAIGTPIMAWSLLRRVPLWRAVAEPAAAGVLASLAAMLVAPSLFALLVPLAIGGAAWRLERSFRGPAELGRRKNEVGALND